MLIPYTVLLLGYRQYDNRKCPTSLLEEEQNPLLKALNKFSDLRTKRFQYKFKTNEERSFFYHHFIYREGEIKAVCIGIESNSG